MTDSITEQQLVSQLENIFETIHIERMADIPIINHDLQVQAIGFHQYNELWLGVMITPWFMNLMLLPAGDTDWSAQTELSQHQHIFPSGRYTFIAAHETAIGHYQSCSLFSPMFEFADQQAAVDTANAVIEALMDKENQDVGDIHQQQVTAIWNGEAEVPEDKPSSNNPEANSTESNTHNSPSLNEHPKQAMSRRELIFGGLLPDEDRNP